MATINPYLIFNGTCEEAFNHYKNVFGGNFNQIARFKDMPPIEGKTVNENDAEKLMHVSLPISSETTLLGSDSSSDTGDVNFGNNIGISVNVSSKDEAIRIFDGLANNGKILMPMADTFWGAFFGMCIDKFGINWMVNLEKDK